MVNKKFSLWVENLSQQKKKSPREQKRLTQKEKVLRRKETSHSERNCLPLKENFSQQNKKKVKNNND